MVELRCVECPMPYMRSPVKGREHYVKYVATGQHADNGDDPFAEADIACATFIMSVAENNFPGFPWMAESDIAHGLASVRLPAAMGHWQYVFSVKQISEADGWMKVREGCGEILERFNLSTSGRVAEAGATVGLEKMGGPNSKPN